MAPSKDGLTKIHQWITVAAVPVAIAIAGWIAVNFDTMRLDVNTLKVSQSFIQKQVAHHTTQLDTIERVVLDRKAEN